MAQLPLIDLTAEGITFEVDYGYRDASSPDEGNFGSQQPATTLRKFKMKPYFKRHIFIRWLLGEVAVNYSGGGSADPDCTITRTYPQRHPLYLSLFANRVASVRGFKQIRGPTSKRTYNLTEYNQDGSTVVVPRRIADYEYAIVEVEYDYYKFKPYGDGEFIANDFTDEYQRYTEITDPRTSGEYLSLPGAVMKYVRKTGTAKPHGTVIPYGVGKILPLEEFTVIWHRVPYEVYWDGKVDGGYQSFLHKRIHGSPEEGINPYLGTVGQFGLFGRQAETLLFSGFQAVRRFGPIPTSWEWDLHYTFTFDPFRWNWKYYFANASTGPIVPANGWYFVSTRGIYPDIQTDPDYGDYIDTIDDDSIYNTRNHANLFKPCEIED